MHQAMGIRGHQAIHLTAGLLKPQVNFDKIQALAWDEGLFSKEQRPNHPVARYWNQLTGRPSLVYDEVFWAPEVKWRHHDQRSDVWSAGMVLAALFSDFDPTDARIYKALCQGQVDVCAWRLPNLAPVVATCLSIDPDKRIHLHELIVLLSQEAANASELVGLPSSLYEGHIHGLKLAVLDFTNRNPLFHFGLTNGFVALQMELADFLATGKKWVFEQSNDPLLSALNQVRLKRMQALRDKGEDNLWCVSHWLYWQYEGQTKKTPLLMVQVNLDLVKSLALEYQLQPSSSKVLVNEVLRIFLADRLHLGLPSNLTFDEASLTAFFNRLTQDLEALGGGPVRVEQYPLVGNLSYRHYTIGANYTEMLRQAPNSICLELMGLESRESQQALPFAPTFPWSNMRVLPSDPSQDKALGAASTASLVIEGPPGTGKSQTIVNLIAQALAAGERVLFVSEKRAALEVVYRRLEQAGLDPLALLVHDTLRDRKSIIDSIRTSYSKLMCPLERDAKLGAQLAAWRLEEAVNELDTYWTAVRDRTHGFSLNELFLHRPKGLCVTPEHLVPGYDSWLKNIHLLNKIRDGLLHLEGHEIWNHSPLSRLHPWAIATSNDPIGYWANSKKALQELWPALEGLIRQTGLPATMTIGQVMQLASLARSCAKLLQRNLFRLLMDDTQARRDYDSLKARYLTKKTMLHKIGGALGPMGNLDIGQIASIWAMAKLEPNSPEVQVFIETSLNLKGGDFGDRGKDLLELAMRHAKASWQMHELEGLFMARYGSQDPMAFIQEMDLLQDLVQRTQLHMPQVFGYLHTLRKPDEVLRAFLECQGELSRVETAINILDHRFRNLTPTAGLGYIHSMDTVFFGDSEVAILLWYNSLSPDVKFCLSEAETSIAQLGLDAQIKELSRAYVARPNLEQYHSPKINQCLNAIDAGYEDLLSWNSAKLLDAQAAYFQQKVAAAQTPAERLGKEAKIGRTQFKKGLRLLHREMDKQRKFKSLRSILLDGQNTALMALKPVFMLSPVAVAEIFPCVAQLFDLVVFDEAGQLRLEEVLPICHRAKRVVVVGDSQQLPPSTFFRNKIDQEIDGNVLKFNSLFSAAKTAFPTHSLCWHYRSSHQDLIAFNNVAFYQGQLSAFPSFGGLQAPLVFQNVPHGLYHHRQNHVEAQALVESLAREMNLRPTLSYAVIAFSEAQQEAVELALERHKLHDLTFARILDREETRYDSGVFSGLLIKNLENMQGEERDVVMVTVGYGPDESGKLAQHFGPIMHEGGDRRINVLSSRARLQIQVFCSFDPDRLQPKENGGVWVLQQWLRYVRAHSGGKRGEAEAILRVVHGGAGPGVSGDTLVENVKKQGIEEWILSHGHENGTQLRPLFTGSGEREAYFYSVWQQGKETGQLIETEPTWINTWKEFFVSRRVMARRGYQVQKLSTQFIQKEFRSLTT